MELSTIHQRLSEGPSLIESAAQLVAERKRALDEAKRQVEKAKASAVLQHQDAKNQSVLNAHVVNDPAVDAAEAEAIKAHGEYLVAVAKHDRQVNEFDAVRKQANLVDSSIRSGIHG